MTPFRIGRVLLIAFAFAVLIFLFAPTVLVFGMAFNAAPDLSFPPSGFSLQWFESYFSNRAWMEATTRSAIIGVSATVLSVFIGTAAGIGLAKTRGRAFAVMSAVIGLPLVLPAIVLGLALFDLYSRLQVVGNMFAVILAHTLLGIPYVFVNVIASFTKFDFRLEQAAQGLGAHPRRSLVDVTLPGIMPGIVAGGFFAFIASWDELAVTMLIAGTDTRTLPVVMFSGIRFNVDPTIAAVAAVLTAVVLVMAVLRTLLERRLQRGIRQ
ncbi:hypothetical protein BVC93_14430 [Mycobacterium sp. MS1601]|uniref:ABC transporter permease n=1 Tax=Mycobacterium sp. MS1601 TaxID=1936029 RepID=UPI000979526D|nr:ABC transporter permease [Mycobacterium sp. MS1601]AQA03407.1 hypothetical protein BVC93_14430 [Mycobacterium sp. MS1601]